MAVKFTVRATVVLGLISLLWLSGCTEEANSSWHIQTVDMGKAGSLLNLGYGGHYAGRASSLAIDGQCHPHISYLYDEIDDWQSGPCYVKYAAWNGSGWGIQKVDGSTGDAHSTSLALDSRGHPHISYYAHRPRRVTYRGTRLRYVLKHAAWNGQSRSWDIQPVDSAIPVASFASLVLDSNDYPHITYCGYSDLQKHYEFRVYSVKYAAWNGSSWDIQTVDGVGERPSLALDSSGQPHISYTMNGDLKYAVCNGSSWDIQTVDTGHTFSVCLALNSGDHPYISYERDDNLKHAAWNGSSWGIQTVDTGQIYSVSLALDGSDQPHISYRRNRALKYAAYNGSSWDIETVDDTRSRSNSLALDSSGFAHISYGSDGNLKHATNAPSYRGQTGTVAE